MRAATLFEVNYHLENDSAFKEAHENFLTRLDRIPMPEGTAARFIIDTNISNVSSLLMFINTERGYLSYKSLITEK